MKTGKMALCFLILVAVGVMGFAPSDVSAQSVEHTGAGFKSGSNITFSAAGDFSLVANPNGPWSFGYSDTLGGAFNLFVATGPCCGGANAWVGPGGLPFVSHTGRDHLLMHPGPFGQYSVVRWTAPENGRFDVTSFFLGLAATTTDVHVLLNSSPIFDRNINGLGNRSEVNLSLTLKTGDTLDFAVGFGVGGTSDVDSTGFEALITDGSVKGDGYAFLTLEVPGSTRTRPNGLNDRGQIVGDYADTSGKTRGFLITLGDSNGVNRTAITSFDAVAEFSLVSNPNSPWSYGWSTEVGGPFTLDVTPGTLSGLQGWFGPIGSPGFPLVIYNQFVPLLMHPGPGGEVSVVRWTAPWTGEFQVEGSFSGLDQFGRTNTDAHVLVNGSPSFASDIVGFSRADFNLPLTLNRGDTVDFVVGFGSDGTFNFDSTGLRAVITPFQATTIDFPGATATQARGINNAGHIVGFYLDAAGMQHGYLLKDGNFTTVDFPGAFGGYCGGIDAAGRITGAYRDQLGVGHGFLWDRGTFTSFEFPGSLNTQPFGINLRGEIAGFYVLGGGSHAFLFKDGNFLTIDFPAASATLGIGINAHGEVVGQYNLTRNNITLTHGFLLSGGSFTTIDFPGTQVTSLRGINAAGQIVGSRSRFGQEKGVLAIPGPAQ